MFLVEVDCGSFARNRSMVDALRQQFLPVYFFVKNILRIFD